MRFLKHYVSIAPHDSHNISCERIWAAGNVEVINTLSAKGHFALVADGVMPKEDNCVTISASMRKVPSAHVLKLCKHLKEMQILWRKEGKLRDH
uniref:Uncharacterized protein n=1 Tax=Rhipicephalus zambeziensis TaxID=60191 RepID=A0A224Z158_9ACAR